MKTKIEWTDYSWNPIRARNKATGKLGHYCEHKSDGCRFCYAEGMNKRLGTGLAFKPGHRRDVDIFLDEKMLLLPLAWKRPGMVFVCSMTDLFADFVEDDWIDRIFAVMALAPQHTFQVLTKRPERMRLYMANLEREALWMNVVAELLGSGGLMGRPHPILGQRDPWLPLSNVWLGVSAEDQPAANARIPILLHTPAAVHWVSAEPLLGPIRMDGWLSSKPHDTVLDWVVAGGESGPNARPMHLSWVRSIIAQCKTAEVPIFIKQMGTYPETDIDEQRAWVMRDRKGGNPAEWPEDVRIREMPPLEMKAAGRLLDGVLHDAWPESATP